MKANKKENEYEKLDYSSKQKDIYDKLRVTLREMRQVLLNFYL